MSDYNSGLPIRSEADGLDERVQTKIVDSNNPDTQQMEVDTDNNAHVEAHGNDPAGLDRVVRLSEEGHTNSNGIYDVSTNTDPSNNALIAHVRSATPGDTQSTERVTSIENVAGDVRALDISLHDEVGEAYSADNPLPVTFEESEGDEKHEEDTAVDVVKDGTDTQDYVVATGRTLLLHQVLGSASGKMKVELQIGDGAAVEVFTKKAVRFNSTAQPNADVDLKVPVKVVGTANGTTVRVIRTNRDNQVQDLSTTIVGVERNT